RLLHLKALACTTGGALPGARRAAAALADLEAQLSRVVQDALAASLHADAAIAWEGLALLHHDQGDPARTEREVVRAAEAAVRGADPTTAAYHLANTARCLTQIEGDVGRASSLLDEAQALAAAAGGLEIPELYWGIGLLRHWHGDGDGAIAALERAHAS